ncbi:MAG: NlpC/P60 family protein [Chloroflexota bacterium]
MTYLVQGAALAPTTTGVPSSGHLRRLLVIFFAIALAITMIAIEAPLPTEARASGKSDAQKIVAYARTHIGARFRMGSIGNRFFDCSGLVFRVYQQAHLLKKIGGSRKRAAGYFKWFRQRGLASRHNPKPGDLIWWTKHGKIIHTGLYVGDGKAISALINPWGVKRHSLGGVRAKVLAFGHTRLDR